MVTSQDVLLTGGPLDAAIIGTHSGKETLEFDVMLKLRDLPPIAEDQLLYRTRAYRHVYRRVSADNFDYEGWK